MNKFSSALRGYDKNEVNAFIDDIIAKVESMVSEIEEKDKKILAYKKLAKKNKLTIKELTEKIEDLEERAEFTKEFINSDTTEDEIVQAMKKSKIIIDEAKVQASRIIEDANENADIIISECLMNAKKSEMELNNLKHDIEKLKQKKETLYYSS